MQFSKDMTSPHAALFQEARAMLLAVDGITEVRKEAVTTYINKDGGVCHLRTMDHGIDIGFLKGAKMRDELGLLTGRGKVMRVLPLEEMNEPALMYYLAQAFQLNRTVKTQSVCVA